jgi:hypothetical protein
MGLSRKKVDTTIIDNRSVPQGELTKVKHTPTPKVGRTKRVLSLRKIVPIIDIAIFIINKRPITMIWTWIKERFAEPSTYQGVVAIASAVGATISPELWEAIATFAVGLIGLIQVVKKEKEAPKE